MSGRGRFGLPYTNRANVGINSQWNATSTTYGDQALDLVEQSCDVDMRLQFALSGVWLLPDSPVLGRFRALMAKYGFGLTEDKRKPLSPHPDCW